MEPRREAKEVVVLIHGLARTRASMFALSIAARRAGYRVVNWRYASRRKTIAGHAAALAAEMRRLLPAGTPIHFITHSLGGIIVRKMLATNDITAGAVVMIGPPNRGSEIVDVLRDCSIYQLATGKPGQELGTDAGSVPNTLPPVTFDLGVIAGSRCLNPLFAHWIGTASDGKVSIERAQVASMRDFAIVDRSHTSMPWMPDVIALSMRFLQERRFAA